MLQLFHMLKPAFRQYLCLLLFIAATGAASAAQAVAASQEAQSLPAATSDFVQMVLSRGASPSAVAVTFENLSSLPSDAQDNIKDLILTSFRNANARLVKAEQAVAEIQITFSEDWQGYVWIAKIQQGSASQVVIKKVSRQQHAASARLPSITLRKIPVWQQDGPILDFFQDNQNLLVLEPGQLALYASDAGQWRPRQTLGIPHQQPWPRDLRGRLEVHSGQISVFLPGASCKGTLSPPALNCTLSDDPWPIDQGSLVAFFNPRRNFFSGLLAGQSAGASVAPFFSGAAWQAGEQRNWLFTGIDGRTRLFQNDLGSPAATFTGWGSTLAAVHSICGSGWQVLTSAATDISHPDSIQAVEIAGHEAQPVSAAVDLAGVVQSMWTAGTYSQVVNGVLQSQTSGKYEAFTLTVICNQ